MVYWLLGIKYLNVYKNQYASSIKQAWSIHKHQSIRAKYINSGLFISYNSILFYFKYWKGHVDCLGRRRWRLCTFHITLMLFPQLQRPFVYFRITRLFPQLVLFRIIQSTWTWTSTCLQSFKIKQKTRWSPGQASLETVARVRQDKKSMNANVTSNSTTETQVRCLSCPYFAYSFN